MIARIQLMSIIRTHTRFAPTEPKIVSWVVGAYGAIRPYGNCPIKTRFFASLRMAENATPVFVINTFSGIMITVYRQIETIHEGLSDLDLIIKEAVSGGMRRNHEVRGNWSRLSRELGIVRESFYRSPTIINNNF